jgi:DNA-binding NtrC family response regulator
MTKRHKLLVIDDSEEVVDSLNSFLSPKYDVITAYKGLDGLKAFEVHEGDIDLVITDWVMPEISGVGVISVIKKKYPGTPVIAITGRVNTPSPWQWRPMPTWYTTNRSSLWTLTAT